jgi:hypothetical protein
MQSQQHKIPHNLKVYFKRKYPHADDAYEYYYVAIGYRDELGWYYKRFDETHEEAVGPFESCEEARDSAIASREVMNGLYAI